MTSHPAARHLLRLLQRSRGPVTQCISSPIQAAGMCSQTENGTETEEDISQYTSILGHSIVFQQCGLDINELPMVVRRMNALDFSHNGFMYPVQTPSKITEEDEAFNLQLMDCRNIRQVFQLLEVPGDKVTCYSAAFALQRLCALQQGSADKIQSFLKKAILHELCGTITRNIYELANETIINLITCYQVSVEYDTEYKMAVNSEVERRIGDSMLSIKELCQILDILNECPDHSKSLASNVWIHIGSRFQEFDEVVVPEIYARMQYLPAKLRYMWSLLDQRVTCVWWKLNKHDVSLILESMTTHNQCSIRALQSLTDWVPMYANVLNDTHLKLFLKTYIQFNMELPRRTLDIMARYISVRIDKMDREVAALLMNYCRHHHVILPSIMNTIAKDFIQNSHRYTPTQILCVLRGYGQLNYCPKDLSRVFSVVESVLEKRFSEFTPASMVELLASFVYIEQFPINFLNRVFTDHFHNQIIGIKDDGIRYQATIHMLEIQAAILVERPDQLISRKSARSMGLYDHISEVNNQVSYRSLFGNMARVVGLGNFTAQVNPKNTPYIIDFVLKVSKDGMIYSRWNTEKHDNMISVALLRTSESEKRVTVPNDNETATKYMGHYAMKLRLLTKMGYKVIEVSPKHYQKLETNKATDFFIKQLLHPYMNFDSLNITRPPDRFLDRDAKGESELTKSAPRKHRPTNKNIVNAGFLLSLVQHHQGQFDSTDRVLSDSDSSDITDSKEDQSRNDTDPLDPDK